MVEAGMSREDTNSNRSLLTIQLWVTEEAATGGLKRMAEGHAGWSMLMTSLVSTATLPGAASFPLLSLAKNRACAPPSAAFS